MSELVFISVNQAVNIGMVPCDAHNHKNKGPYNDACVAGTEEKRQDKESDNKQHAAYRDIPEKSNDRNGQRYTQKSGKGKTVKHHTAGCGNAFSSAEMKENRPVMTNHTAETSKHGAEMASGNQPCNQTG